MSYELTEDQTAIIINIAKYMKIFAYTVVIIGLVDLVDVINTGLYSNLKLLFSLFFFKPLLEFL